MSRDAPLNPEVPVAPVKAVCPVTPVSPEADTGRSHDPQSAQGHYFAFQALVQYH